MSANDRRGVNRGVEYQGLGLLLLETTLSPKPSGPAIAKAPDWLQREWIEWIGTSARKRCETTEEAQRRRV